MSFLIQRDEQSLAIPGPQGALEAIITPARTEHALGMALVAHPDPQQKGTMHNKVVSTCARTMANLGYHALRFNYAGVEQSQGQYGHIEGEIQDAKAALHYLYKTYGCICLWLIGFSFGAYITAALASQIGDKGSYDKYPISIQGLISIAPGIKRFDFDQLASYPDKWHIIHGEYDDVADIADLDDWLKNNLIQPSVHRVPTGHFFDRKLHILSQIIQKVVMPHSCTS